MVSWMKHTLMDQPFSYLTGGAPASCGNLTCTVCFCWHQSDLEAHCLTAYHLLQCSGTNIAVKVHGNIILGTVSMQREDEDWVVFKVPVTPHIFDGGLDLMHGFDNIPIVGFSRPVAAEAVWKLGAFTGMSVGRVVVVNVSDHTFTIDGMVGDEGDSGGAVCLGTQFNECTLVGILLQGDSKRQQVKALLVDRIFASVATPLQFLSRQHDMLMKMKEKEKAANEKEKAANEKVRAEVALRELAEFKLAHLMDEKKHRGEL